MKWLTLLLIAIFIITSNSDYSRQSYLDQATERHNFSIFWWEIKNLPNKWLHLVWEKFPGNKPSDKERTTLIKEYLVTSNKLNNNKQKLTAKEKTKLEKDLKSLRARTEESIESIISNVLIEEELGISFNILIPPTDFKLDSPPDIVVTSPRDKIVFSSSRLISNNLTELEKSEIELLIESNKETSAIVDKLGGLGTYPAFVSDKGSLRNLLQTASHEWLHNYWILHPIGRHMWDSSEMNILNETAANIAGDELGDIAFQSIGGIITEHSSSTKSSTEYKFYLNEILKETRLEVDKLLAKKKIEEAENYMATVTRNLQSKGYPIRKINQAYFAFHGNYADNPSSTSSIGIELKEYRGYFGNIGQFIKSISKIENYTQFIQILNSKRKVLEPTL